MFKSVSEVEVSLLLFILLYVVHILVISKNTLFRRKDDLAIHSSKIKKSLY